MWYVYIFPLLIPVPLTLYCATLIYLLVVDPEGGCCLVGQWHCVTGAGACLGGFLITHIAISLCLASIFPCSWSCFRCTAEAIESIHCCLVRSGSCVDVLRDVSSDWDLPVWVVWVQFHKFAWFCHWGPFPKWDHVRVQWIRRLQVIEIDRRSETSGQKDPNSIRPKNVRNGRRSLQMFRIQI